jgi:hypothetical protein
MVDTLYLYFPSCQVWLQNFDFMKKLVMECVCLGVKQLEEEASPSFFTYAYIWSIT